MSHREEVPFRDCALEGRRIGTGHGVGSLPGVLSLCSSGPRSRLEEGVEEDMVLGLFLVRYLCALLVLEGRSGRGHGVGSLTGAIFVLPWSWGLCGRNSGREEVPFRGRGQELCESRGGRPGLFVLMNLTFLWT